MKNFILALFVCSCTLPTTPTPSNEPPIILSSKDLIAAYENNEVNADSIYKNKRVQISGVVSEIGKDLLDDPYITIAPTRGLNAREIQCEIDEKSAASLKKGQKVTVIGLVTGLVMNVQLEDCKLTE